MPGQSRGWLVLCAGLTIAFAAAWFWREWVAGRRQAVDPMLHALEQAPIDDEPETPEEAIAVAIAREELARGKGVPWEEVKRARRVLR